MAFPYFWLGREAESIPTPWRTVWVANPRCQHRDDGRGVCIDCGEFLPSADGDYWSPDRDDDVAVPCIDGTDNHVWVTSDEDENICYCERCGCREY